MSKHDDAYGLTALPTMLEFLGTSIIYRKADTTEITITAVLSHPDEQEIDTDQGRVLEQKRTAQIGRVEAEPLYSGVDEADLREDAEVDIVINVAGDKETWAIVHIDRADEMATLHLVRRELIEWTMDDYRSRIG